MVQQSQFMRSDTYRILTRDEAAAQDKKCAVTAPFVQELIKRNRLLVGSVVKIWVEAVGKPNKCAEEIWVVIHAINHNYNTVRGIVNTRTERGLFHGLHYESVVEFKMNRIIDVSISGAEQIGIRQ